MVGTFALDLNKFAAKAGKNADAVVRKVVLKMGARIVERSPVGDPSKWADYTYVPPGYVGGHFRGNWQYSLAAPAADILPDIDPTGEPTIKRIKNSIPDKAGGHVHYLTNNLPYALRLEYMAWSSQAPHGMVGITVAEYKQIVRGAVQEVKQ